uniref:Fibrinogen C-terminal domain-containing protein n=1 Tax=Amphimedon queenslandica TaxID=400682 RepID=A0A1X7UKG0_AMPQE
MTDVISQALLNIIKGVRTIACLPQFISSSNLALTFDSANSTCTAACTTCSDTSNTDTNQYNTDDELLNELLNATRNNSQDIQGIKQKMDGIISSLSHIKETAISNAGAINDILLLVEDLIMLHNDSSSFSPIPTSCQEIKNKQPNSPSGVYLLKTANNETQNAYCNMEELCGSGGGWTRLAYLDMSDATQNCPSGFRLYQSGGVRACGRPATNSGSCVPVQFPSNGISYSQICGRVTGYQYGAPNALQALSGHNNMNSHYVDGVSITRGSPRQHVWTLIGGLQEASLYENGGHNCPCSQGSPQSPQSFIGNDYFCESGNPATDNTWQFILYESDPLWDGKGCGSLEGNCCTAPGLPWFNKVLGTNTTDYLELRVCGDETTDNEDVPVGFYELYDGQECNGIESPCCNVPGIPWFHRDYGSNTTTDYIELRVCANAGGEDSLFMMTENQPREFHDSDPYTVMQGDQWNENMYELPTINKELQQSSVSTVSPNVAMGPKQRQSSWSKPQLCMTVLLCLILILLIIILGIVVYDKYATGNNVECTNTATGASSSSNTNEWADRIAQNVYDKLNITDGNRNISNFNEWANGVISLVNQSLPDFNEWANGVVSLVNQSLPDFNEWANGVVSKVNSNVTGSLPDFDEWANGVVSKVNSNVTGSLPDFDEWANGVVSKNNTNFTELDKQILQTTRDSAQKLINIVNTLSNLQDTSTSTAGVVNGILLIAQELLVLHNESTALPTSCKEIKDRQPNTPSGYYILAGTNGTYSTYCSMGTLCSSGGGWTRLAYLDMTDATQNCPSGFRLYQSGGVRACGNTNSGGGCVSVQFPSNGISYSQICGRVTGYQYGHPDGIDGVNDINSYYVDGVSITRGSPRQHVWSFLAQYTQTLNNCPCASDYSGSVRSFMGTNYFCESGNPNSGWSYTLYTSDPLWDGQGCGSLESPCCNVTGIPWFHRDYGNTTTTDHIELRVCKDYSDEDSPFSIVDIYSRVYNDYKLCHHNIYNWTVVYAILISIVTSVL